jgi:zinc transport system substrate-binding protein
MRAPALAALTLAAAPAAADVPVVVTDTPVVHSLVSLVMGDLGAPAVLVEQGADEHSFQLRPSQAAALADAGVIFWVGEELTPWLARALEATSGAGKTIALLDAPGVTLMNYGDGSGAHDHDHGHGEAKADAHDHDHGHDHGHEEAAAEEHDHAHEGHDHEDAAAHDDHAHEDHGHDEAGHEGHGHDEAGHEGHDHAHGGVDPHAWLYPENAKVWLSVVAAELSAADPANAAVYAANAAAATLRIDAAMAEAAATLAPAHDKPIVVFHDAYGYFARAFDVEIAGSIALGDAAAPGAQRLRELQERIGAEQIACVFREPQHDASIAESVAADAGVGLGTLDPSGSSLTYGPALYETLITSLASNIADCVAASG